MHLFFAFQIYLKLLHRCFNCLFLYYTLICNNIRTRVFRSSIFVTFLQFSQQPIKIQKPTIPHLKGLIVDIIILLGQEHSTIRDRPDPLNVKKQTFQEKWAWQAIEAATPLSFYNFIVHNHS